MNTVREQLIYYSFISFYSSEWRTVPVLFCTPVEDLSVEVVYEEPGHAAFPLDLSHPNLERLQLTPASGSVSLDSNGFNVSARSTPVPATLTLDGWQYPPPPRPAFMEEDLEETPSTSTPKQKKKRRPFTSGLVSHTPSDELTQISPHRRRAGYTEEDERLIRETWAEEIISLQAPTIPSIREALDMCSDLQPLRRFEPKQLVDKIRCLINKQKKKM